MKKVKMMLLSLALFAVVGGALAFKARFHTAYCTAPVGQNGTCGFACPALVLNSTTVNAVNSFCTTTSKIIDGVAGCVDAQGNALQCNTTTKLITD